MTCWPVPGQAPAGAGAVPPRTPRLDAWAITPSPGARAHSFCLPAFGRRLGGR